LFLLKARDTFRFVTQDSKDTGIAGMIIVAAASAIIFVQLISFGGVTQAQEEEGPVLTFSDPANGDAFSEPAGVLVLCFDRPIDRRDLQDDGYFYFDPFAPNSSQLASRQVFQEDSLGIAIYPQVETVDEPEGEWRLEFGIRDPETLAVTEGVITWTVEAGGSEAPQASPPLCLESGFTATPRPSVSAQPTVSQRNDPTPTATVTGDGEAPNEADDDDPDILVLALLTIGAAGGAGLIALIGFFVRRGVGYEPHRPGPDDEPPHH
jgi:hypothetical protein